MSCSSTVEHFSHPQHPLVLKENVIIERNNRCAVCGKFVTGSLAYTCSSDDIGCQKFYLHKSCAELPEEIIRDKRDLHPLTLLRRSDNYTCECDVCNVRVNFAYACVACIFDLCVTCAFISTSVSDQRVIRHEGHSEHTLTLHRRAAFRCDACYKEFDDYSYVCYTCDFWIHKECAFFSPIISNPTFHHHPLTLIFSIPVMLRYFVRYCYICDRRIQSCSWSYYCHKCTIFVHMACSTRSRVLAFGKKIEANDIVDEEPDFSQFPLPSEESLFDLIIHHCKLQVEIQGEGHEKCSAISGILNYPHIIKKHWSHRDHPLELFQVTLCENDDNDSDDDKRVLICDGCIQPITASHASYYACIQCCFFLHAFCATKLPAKLLSGACSFHPQHSFTLGRYNKFYDFYKCGICCFVSNGFYYKCEICDIKIEIRCAFLPARIRHKSHKQHFLVQRRFSNYDCSVTNYRISEGVEYTCETCRALRIHIICAFYPSRLKHRYDDHPISLKHPPFFYEGVIYCDMCEEPVNNHWLLYHCDKCDYSFHHRCIRWYEKVKLGGTIKHSIGNQPHTLTLVFKRTTRKNSSPYFCVICGEGYKLLHFFECHGCGYLACIFCIRSIHNQ